MTCCFWGSLALFSAVGWDRCCFMSRSISGCIRRKSSPSGKAAWSFHGGFLGVFIAMILFARRKMQALQVTDFMVPLVPLGLAAGRWGNFVNAELWGRPADPSLPWAMVFPNVDALPRHPSQLYQAGLEGLLLFVLLWLYAARPRRVGQVSGAFMLGYGVFRFVSNISVSRMSVFSVTAIWSAWGSG